MVDEPLPRSPRSGPDLWAQLLRPDQSDAAMAALAQRGVTSAERDKLEHWMMSGSLYERLAACRLVETLGLSGVQGELEVLMGHPDQLVRLAAARAMAAVGDRSALMVLARRVGDPDPDVRAAVRQAMTAISGPPRPTRGPAR
jgi:HEAT repeat protein